MNENSENKQNIYTNDDRIGEDNEAIIRRKRTADPRTAPMTPAEQRVYRAPQPTRASEPARRPSPAASRRTPESMEGSTIKVSPAAQRRENIPPARPVQNRRTPPLQNGAVGGNGNATNKRPQAPLQSSSLRQTPSANEKMSVGGAVQRNAQAQNAPIRAVPRQGEAPQSRPKQMANDDLIPVRVVKKPLPQDVNRGAPHAVRRAPQNVPNSADGATKKSDAAALIAQSAAPVSPAAAQAPKVGTGGTDRTTARNISLKGDGSMMSGIIKAILYMVVVIVVASFISVFAIKIGNDVFAFVKSDATIDVTIPEGATVSDIADILSGDGIIKYPSVFKLYASLKKDDGPFVAGSYTVSPSMSYDDLRDAFKEHVATGTTWITIPEGYSCDEIIDLMVSKGIGTREKYIDVINNYDFDYWFIDTLEADGYSDKRSYRLEGYLFPDTYEFYNASSEEMVINKLLRRFNEVFVQDYKTKAQELGYSVDQVLTIASLIEKEAGKAADYMYVSSVFHNRLKNSARFPKLESDATVAYAIQIGTGERPQKVTPEDLKYDSPYNTYLNSGLMPGPITNPSASAIRYALYPANTSYYYFVTADNGTAYYGSSLPEHQQNIETVKALNKSLSGETNAEG